MRSLWENIHKQKYRRRFHTHSHTALLMSYCCFSPFIIIFFSCLFLLYPTRLFVCVFMCVQYLKSAARQGEKKEEGSLSQTMQLKMQICCNMQCTKRESLRRRRRTRFFLTRQNDCVDDDDVGREEGVDLQPVAAAAPFTSRCCCPSLAYSSDIRHARSSSRTTVNRNNNSVATKTK